MLGNCEKMLLISSPPNQWPQNNQIDDPKGSLNNNMASVAAIAATVTGVGERVMDQKVAAIAQDHHHLLQQQQQQMAQQKSQLQQQQQQQQQQQNQEALRCPRCDSTNTKFCYYNNYSLSQPRHFCKACKRYWTRGGTLRNVPVGGGCRKNKRVKRPPNSSSSSTTSLTNNNNNSVEGSVNSASSVGGGGVGNGGHIHDLLSSASNHVNHPLFYGLPTNHSANSDINFPFSRYDLQNPPQINGLGLGFSSGLVHNMNSMNLHNHPQNTKQIFQDLISSNPLLSNYTSTTTTTTNTTTNTSPPTISSLLASSLHQMKGVNTFQSLIPSYEDNDLHNIKENGGMFNKDVKMEFDAQNRSLDHHHHHHWNNAPNNTQNQIDDQTMASSSDPSILWGSSLFDPANNNLGSSVPSLI